PFVLQPPQRGGGYYIGLMKLWLSAGFTPNVVQEVTEMHTIVSLVAAGIGVSLVPLSTRNIRSEGVVYRELEGTTAQASLAVAWRRDRHSTLVENFLEVARESASQLE
ncbi:MAG TPA: LysR family substrate-binding domain-containing protein, partial [Ktedonobacteraceae bacterium]|nr:LysR family substrate-binding domain-containing protein [Ktedonobacteraceae bacterium]